MIIKKLSIGIATLGILGSFLTPMAFAETTGVIAQNGAFSQSSIDFRSSQNMSVSQNNDSETTTAIVVANNSGGNSSSLNTGGSASVTTGDVRSDISVVNHGNSNTLDLACGCEQGAIDLSIYRNGAFSENKIRAEVNKDLDVNQKNRSRVDTWIDAHNNSGKNHSDFNTWTRGNGSDTGNVTSKIDVHTYGSMNDLKIH